MRERAAGGEATFSRAADDPLLGLGHESERLSRPRFPLTASGQR
jgi:hypothetical protein